MNSHRLNINLVPSRSWWKINGDRISKVVLITGLILFAVSATRILWSSTQLLRGFAQSRQASKRSTELNIESKKIEDSLQSFNYGSEVPRWVEAEAFLRDRGLPWSRILGEIEQSMGDGIKIVNMQRSKGKDQQVLLKIKAESLSNASKQSFIEKMAGNALFVSILMDREEERMDGGWEFDLSLTLNSIAPIRKAEGSR